jgi:hypothetical protein
MAHVKRVLGHVSERMGESYVLIAGSQVEPFLQQVWVTGPGNPDPGQVVLTPAEDETAAARDLLVDLAAIPTEHGLCTFKPVVGGVNCPFGRDCHNCEHFVLTGADYGYWKRQEQRWAALAEGAPDATTRDYIYTAFERSSQALAGLEKASWRSTCSMTPKNSTCAAPTRTSSTPSGPKAGAPATSSTSARHTTTPTSTLKPISGSPPHRDARPATTQQRGHDLTRRSRPADATPPPKSRQSRRLSKHSAEPALRSPGRP